MNLIILFVFVCTLVSSTNGSNHHDFCVADLEGLENPSGYHCKPPNTVTIDDFVSDFNYTKTVYATDTSGLNGLNLAAGYIEIPPGHMVPIHTHTDAAEIIIVIKGEVIYGFFTLKKAFVKTLFKGELIVIPKGLLHFAINPNNNQSAASCYNDLYSTSYPIFQYLKDNLFANNISSNLIAKAIYLDVAQMHKLKNHFGRHS